MKRLWMSVPIVALALPGFAPMAQASGTNTSGELAGASCGVSANMWGGAAGVLQPGEADWYDASYAEAGDRYLELESTGAGIFLPFLPGGGSTSVTLYEWDRPTNTCTAISTARCNLGFTLIGHVPEVFNVRPCWDVSAIPGVPFVWGQPTRGIVYVPRPGDYQVKVTHNTAEPAVYTLGEAEGANG